MFPSHRLCTPSETSNPPAFCFLRLSHPRLPPSYFPFFSYLAWPLEHNTTNTPFPVHSTPLLHCPFTTLVLQPPIIYQSEHLPSLLPVLLRNADKVTQPYVLEPLLTHVLQQQLSSQSCPAILLFDPPHFALSFPESHSTSTILSLMSLPPFSSLN